uniref:dynein regulatory complex subunit 2 isoform X1 n=1 Tax=Scatophagus argus TaxID=75038 RepID=UPI001ED8430F|nr:dynein regulatory complex subunit 2 isoform X1 [Scatophagus argus]
MPKKAKKGGGEGGAKTEEERLLYLQQRAQAEEEMAKKKEEVLTLFLKDKLQKEEKNTAVNLLKLNEGWRSILRQTRAAELRNDITVLSQTFERHLDGLDGIMKNVERDLQEAERQSAQVRRIHLQHVERLWAQQDKRLMFVQQQWEDSLGHLTSVFSCERKQMSESCEQQRADLQDSTFALEQQHAAAMDETHRLYSKIIKLYESTHRDRVAKLMQVEKEKLKDKALQHQQVAELCSQDTQQFNKLLSENQRLIEQTDADVKKVKRLQDLVIQVREKLNSSDTENQSVEQDLTATRNQMNRRTKELREQLSEAQTVARKQLTDLTVHSDNAARNLQAAVAKGERALRVAEMCHKLESQQQNISLVPPEEHRPQTAGPEVEQPAKEVREFLELQQLTRRVNAAVLQRAALRGRKDDVSRENRQLRLLLHQHLDAMTVSDGTFDGRHALLAVFPAPKAPPDANRRHAVIEAVHAVKHSL